MGSKARKKFLMPTELFCGSGAPSESKLLKLGQKKCNFPAIASPPKSIFLERGGRIFFDPHQIGPKALRKLVWSYLTHSWAMEGFLSRKSLILGRKTEISEGRFGRNFCMWVSSLPPNFFSAPATPEVSPNFFWLPNSKWKSNYEKSLTPPPKKKGPFFGGGGIWNEISTFRQVNEGQLRGQNSDMTLARKVSDK